MFLVQAVSSHSGEADIPASALKIQHCQLSDIPDTLVHMTECRHLRSILQCGLLPGGGDIAGNKQRNMNHFIPINGLLLSHEHAHPANCERRTRVIEGNAGAAHRLTSAWQEWILFDQGGYSVRSVQPRVGFSEQQLRVHQALGRSVIHARNVG